MLHPSPLVNFINLRTKVLIRSIISDECNAILDKIATKLHDTNAKTRSILNTLSLVEFLLKNGSPRFRIEIEEDNYFIKKLRSFHDEDDEEDLSKSIQALAQRVVSFLENKEELIAAREEAKKLRSRIQGFSSEAELNLPQTSDPKYQGYSSDSYQNEQFSSANGSSLARRMGLEAAQEASTVKTVEQVTPVKVAEAPQVVDLLDFDVKTTLKPVDFITDAILSGDGVIQTKSKFGNKLLPPPPGKTATKTSQNNPTTVTQHTSYSHNSLNLDFSNLSIGGSSQQQAPTATPQYSTIMTGIPKTMHDDVALIDLDGYGATNSSKPVKRSFDFDFGESIDTRQAPPSQAQSTFASDFDIFDLENPSKSPQIYPTPSLSQAAPDSKPKTFGKLPAPPKKNTATVQTDIRVPQTQTKDPSDFLF